MTVTELAWIPSATPGSIPPAFLAACREGIEAQGEWITTQEPPTTTTSSSPSPRGPPSARGAALYQQREDRGVMLITAHWASAGQHAACIASAQNRAAMGAIAAHAVAAEVRYFHVDGVRMFGAETLGAGPLLSVARIGVAARNRGEVEKAWEARARERLAAESGFEHAAGWRIEKEPGREDRDEFVVVGAWRDEEALARFAVGGKAWDDVWEGVGLEMDVTTYNRIA
ncbi:hypothetical protein SAMD00023353_3501000 [Rosellinia necatrix]|uniref:ABM domain-containing protein n=1 Tax=Rosellinia necatrix TaxID=77044 RepID=A0A1W2TMV6_ROSNE|nr:hypothetical protein SAMD00023353_3501000 [Rosellinia necatrix]